MKSLAALALALTLSLSAAAQVSPTPATPKIIGFIYEKGCVNKEFDLYIFLDNGKILHLNENNVPADVDLHKMLEGIQGLNRIFACGITA